MPTKRYKLLQNHPYAKKGTIVEELLKKVSDAEWNWDANNPQHQLLAFLVNHASELLQMAREVERMKEEADCMQDEILRLTNSSSQDGRKG